MKLTLPARPPFSLPVVIRSHGWIQLAPFQEDEQASSLTYIDRLASGRVVELSVREVQGGVSVEAEGELSPAEQVEITDKVRWMLGLDQDFSAFYELAGQEPKLAHVPASARGRILRSPTLFEDVLKTILTTNTLWAATIRMNRILSRSSALLCQPTPRGVPSPPRISWPPPTRRPFEPRPGWATVRLTSWPLHGRSPMATWIWKR